MLLSHLTLSLFLPQSASSSPWYMSSQVPMSQSFVISRFPVPLSICSKIDREISHLDDKQRRFVLHVLVSNLINFHKIHHRGLTGYLHVRIAVPVKRT